MVSPFGVGKFGLGIVVAIFFSLFFSFLVCVQFLFSCYVSHPFIHWFLSCTVIAFIGISMFLDIPVQFIFVLWNNHGSDYTISNMYIKKKKKFPCYLTRTNILYFVHLRVSEWGSDMKTTNVWTNNKIIREYRWCQW